MTTQAIRLKTNIINNSDLERRMFRAMLYTVGFLVLGYVFILSNMVWNIVSRKNIQTESLALSNEVNALELQYSSLSKGIDLNLASSLGFKETKNKEFATRKALGSLNTIAYNEL